MKYKMFRETTKWGDNTPNHTYVLTADKSKMVGYIKKGETEVQVFTKPMGFNTARRTFEPAGEYTIDN